MPKDSTSRRRFLKGSTVMLGAGLAGCTGNGSETADGDYSNFPARDITVIHHGSTGGGNETYSRFMARYLPEYLPGDGDAVVIRMRAGGGRVAAEEFYNATPDGYTIGFLNEDVIPVSLIEDLDFDPEQMNFFGNFSIDVNSIWVGEHTDLVREDDPIRTFADRMDDGEITGAVNSLSGGILPMVMGEVTGWYSADAVFESLVQFDADEEGIRLIGEGDVDYAPGSWGSQALYSTREGGPLEPLLIGTTEEEVPDPDAIDPDLANTLSTAEVPDGQTIMDLTIDGRTFAGPPGLDDELVEMFRDAFDQIAEDDRFIDDLEEAGRPLEYVPGEEMQRSVENRVQAWEENRELLEAIWG